MKTLWLILLIVSAGLLGIVLLRQRLPLGWLTRFGAHLVLAALVIYALNFSGWMTGWYVPINPATIGAVSMLGLPGIGLVLGLQYTLLA